MLCQAAPFQGLTGYCLSTIHDDFPALFSHLLRCPPWSALVRFCPRRGRRGDSDLNAARSNAVMAAPGLPQLGGIARDTVDLTGLSKNGCRWGSLAACRAGSLRRESDSTHTGLGGHTPVASAVPRRCADHRSLDAPRVCRRRGSDDEPPRRWDVQPTGWAWLRMGNQLANVGGWNRHCRDQSRFQKAWGAPFPSGELLS